jgi:type IV secretory pathway TrbD component
VSEQEHTGVPPAGEQIHMPAPSILPLINAAGLALAIVSITLNWILVAFGLIIFAVTAIKWIGDTRREISHLPLEHGDDQH